MPATIIIIIITFDTPSLSESDIMSFGLMSVILTCGCDELPFNSWDFDSDIITYLSIIKSTTSVPSNLLNDADNDKEH